MAPRDAPAMLLRCLQSKCLLMAVVLCSSALASMAQSPVTVTGRVRSVATHNIPILWSIQESRTGLVYILPSQPTDIFSGRPVPIGSTVSLTCNPNTAVKSPAGDVVCSTISNVLFLGANAPMPSVNINVNWLIMLVNVLPGNCSANGTRNNVNVNQVNTLVWKANEGYAAYWANCSYAKYKLNAAQTRIISVDIGCTSDTMVSKCDWGAIGRAADAQARLRLGALYNTTYEDGTLGRRTYVLPAGMISSCGFGGLAWMPGVQTWLLSDPWNGINDKLAPFHENLHNLGLGHAAYNGNEYGDFTSPMGSGYGCPNAPEMRRLNWTTALANLDNINTIQNRWTRYNVNSQSAVATGTYIRVQPRWLANYTANLYISYRVKVRGDIGLADSLHQQVVIHKVTNLNVDNDASLKAWGDAYPTLLTWGGVGKTLDLPEFNMAVRVMVLLNSGNTIALDFCRYSGSVSSCSVANAAISPPPSPPRSPPPPAPTVPPVSYTYMGCYADNSTRAIPVLLGNGTNMTVAGCAAMAQRAGFLLFGVQAGTQCFGGNSVQDAAVLGKVDRCNTPCAGANTTTCGGALANSVYVIDGTCAGGYYGCFADNYYDFAMTWGLDQGGDFNMTWERCQEQARLQGWPYFGLANGNLCWFSEELQNVVKYGPVTGCNKPCSGDSRQTCGGEGEYMFSLYRTDRCGQLPQIKCRPGACGAYPNRTECVSVPTYRSGEWGAWAGQCESRLVDFSDHKGGAPTVTGNTTAFLPPNFTGVTVKPENGIASQRRDPRKNAPPLSPIPKRRNKRPPPPPPATPPPSPVRSPKRPRKAGAL